MGVNKGAISQETADEKLAAWIEQKRSRNSKAAIRLQKKNATKFAAKVDGNAKAKVKAAPPLPVIETADEPAAEEAVEAAAETTEVAAETVETVVEAVAEPAAEEAAPAVEEAPATEEAPAADNTEEA